MNEKYELLPKLPRFFAQLSHVALQLVVEQRLSEALAKSEPYWALFSSTEGVPLKHLNSHS